MLQRTHIRGWAIVWGCVANFVATGVAAFLTTLFVLVAHERPDGRLVREPAAGGRVRGQQAPVVLLGIVLTPLAALTGGLLRIAQVG